MIDSYGFPYGGRGLPPGNWWRRFLPTALGAKLHLWYRGDEVELISNELNIWLDLSGNGRVGTQGTASIRPQYLTSDAAFAGRQSIQFVNNNGVSMDFVNLPDLSALTAAEIYMAVAVDTDPPPEQARAGLWKIGTAAGSNFYPNPSDGFIWDAFGSTTRQVTTDPVPNLASGHIYNVTSIAGEWTARIDGVQLYTTAVNTVGFLAAPVLGGNGADVGMDGRIAEIVLLNAAATPTERALLHSYLGAYNGISVA